MYREFLWSNLLENVHLGEQEGDRRITLSWTLGRQVVRISSGWNWLRIESIYGLCKLQCSIFRSCRQRVSYDKILFPYLYRKIVFLVQILETNIMKHCLPPNTMVSLLKLEHTCRIWGSLHDNDIMPCSQMKVNNISELQVASIFRDEE
jgi:hypothetical protein